LPHFVLSPSCEGGQHPRHPRRCFHLFPSGSGFSGGSSPRGHYGRFSLRWSVRHVSTFLRPFAPRPLRRFLAPMDALTPVRPALRLSQHEHRLTARTGLPDSRTLPSDHSISTHLKCLRHRFGTLSQRRGSPCLCAGSRLHLWLAGSSPTPGRIEFVILRTGRSPPVALHLASRQRSYSWFQVVSVDLERTFTSLTSCAFRRTSRSRRGGTGRPLATCDDPRWVWLPRRIRHALCGEFTGGV
jgi:hypothetical protein